MSDSDIVKRLREAANGVGSLKSDQGDLGLCDDAADEIERLRLIEDEHIARLKDLFELSDDGGHYHEWQDAMRASGRYQDEVS